MARHSKYLTEEERKEARRLYHQKWSRDNIERVLALKRARYAKNTEAFRSKAKEFRKTAESIEYQRAYFQENKENISAKRKIYTNTERGKKAITDSRKKAIDELSDAYIRSNIYKKGIICGFKMNMKDITPEMIELQREKIMLKRIEKSYTS